MFTFIEKYPIVFVAGAIGAGFLLRSIIADRREQVTQRDIEQTIISQNPWNMQGQSLMDNYAYYQTTDGQPRLVYGVGNETNLVSTTMLSNAIAQEHELIMDEVRLLMNAQGGSFDNYINGYNPYDVAIAGAVNQNQNAGPALDGDNG